MISWNMSNVWTQGVSAFISYKCHDLGRYFNGNIPNISRILCVDWRLNNWFSLTIILNNITKDYSLVHCMYPQDSYWGKESHNSKIVRWLNHSFHLFGFYEKKPIYKFDYYIPYKLWLFSKPWPLQIVHIHASSSSLEIWLIMAIFGWTIKKKKNKNTVHKGR